MKDNELIQILKAFDEKRVEQLDDNARNLFNAIMDIADSRDKYKSLYENEKEHVDTLKRIIKKIEKYMEEHSCEESYLDCKFYETTQYKEILDLLKEIK